MKKNKLNSIKSTGYKIPEDYFESFEDRFFNKLEKPFSLEQVDTPGFNVPKDYFDKLEDNVFQKIENDNKPIIRLSSRKTLYYVAGIAASLILALSVFLNKEDEAAVSIEMVETYFQNSDLNSYELAELLSDADLLEDDFEIIPTEYNEDNLESYLLENVDIESFIE